jgi:hypothetical protein
MYETCGRIYQSGLPSCGVFDFGGRLDTDARTAEVS